MLHARPVIVQLALAVRLAHAPKAQAVRQAAVVPVARGAPAAASVVRVAVARVARVAPPAAAVAVVRQQQADFPFPLPVGEGGRSEATEA
mgnify:CR=1 FL=1